MEDIYTWLFDHYALPRMKELDSRHREAAGVCAGRLALNQENTLHFTDFTDTMRLHWGIEAFTLGVRFGLGLNGPREQDMDVSWLVHAVPEKK